MRISFFPTRILIIFVISVHICCTSSNQLNQHQNNSTSGNNNLLWKPNVFQDDFQLQSLEILKDLDIKLEPLSDSRAVTDNIGTIKTGDNTVTVIPKKPVTDWCTENFVNAGRFLGLKQIGTKSGKYTIDGEIINFSIIQDITLHGSIELRISLNKDGLTVWEGKIKGDSELYLIPSGSDGVSECLSNTLINAVYNLLNDKSFVDAVAKSTE